jgi:hypothetical protein
MPKGYVRRVKAPPPRVGPKARPRGITFDDPEDDEWFQRLPPQAQVEMRARWKVDEARDERRVVLAKTTRKRSIAEGTLLFLCTETCLAIPSVGHSLAALAVGAAVGEAWHRTGAGRNRCALIAIGPFAALRIVFAESLIADVWFAMFGGLILLTLAMAIGWSREDRRSDGRDY